MEEKEKRYIPFYKKDGEYRFSAELIFLRNEGALRVLEIIDSQGKKVFPDLLDEMYPPMVYIDDSVPANSPETSEKQQRLLELCRKFKLPVYYGKGIAYLDFADLDAYDVAAVDRDVLMVGGEGNTGKGFYFSPEEMAELLTAENISFYKGPDSIRFIKLTGSLPNHVDARDAARALIERLKGQLKENEALDFRMVNPDALSGPEMSPIYNEAEKIFCGMMQKLPVCTAYFGSLNDFYTSQDLTFRLSSVKPSIDIGNGKVVKKLAPRRVDAVWIGGAYGGTMRAIELTAKALKGKRIAPGLRLSVSPCTADVYAMAADRGYLSDIMEAGGLVLNQCASPKDQARIGEDELMVSNDFHNEEGYAGGTIYLASTYKAIEAALTGWISLGTSKVPKEEKKAPKEIRHTEKPQSKEIGSAAAGATLSGRVWKFGDDIDTDIIMPTQHLSYADWEEVKRHMFEPLRPDLAAKIREGDIIVAGNNFGCGSSREQAAEVIATSGIRCIIAKSFARIFFRNAINNGVLLIECPDLPDHVEEGDTVEVVMGSHISHKGKTYPIPKMPENLARLILAGGLVKSIARKGLEV